jgi:chromosomal replication initiation ATPase DnaA
VTTARPISRIRRLGSCTRKTVSLARIERVVDEVSAEYDVPAAEIRNVRYRPRNVAEARWEAWRRLAGPNDAIISIARHWPCDHTAILNALNKLDAKAAA